MQFLFKCEHHSCELEGEPSLQHPNPEAKSVWTFNTHDLQCEVGKVGPFKNGCRKSWRVYVQLGAQGL
jgi:hypothetical protein